MSTFIANRIMGAYDKAPENGTAKYSAYFVATKLYKKWQDEVDTILRTEGYEAAIVAE